MLAFVAITAAGAFVLFLVSARGMEDECITPWAFFCLTCGIMVLILHAVCVVAALSIIVRNRESKHAAAQYGDNSGSSATWWTRYLQWIIPGREREGFMASLHEQLHELRDAGWPKWKVRLYAEWTVCAAAVRFVIKKAIDIAVTQTIRSLLGI